METIEDELTLNLILEELKIWDLEPKKLNDYMYLYQREGNFWFIKITAVYSGKKIYDLENHAEVLFNWTIFFDGIRHMYYGFDSTKYPSSITNNYWYFHYADIEEIQMLLKEIEKIESLIVTE